MSWLKRLFSKGANEESSLQPVSTLSNDAVQVTDGPKQNRRIVVGECGKCHRPLKAKGHAVKESMRFTCKCGHTNIIQVDSKILESAEVTLAKAARQPAPYVESEEEQFCRQSVDRLLDIYRQHPEGFLRHGEGEAEREIRLIGETLNQVGGMNMMLVVHNGFRVKCNILGAPRNLENMWSGIGEWLG
jgi:hypothetical protein